MYVVVRRYKGSSQLVEELDRKRQGVEELIRGVPGFVAYYAVRTADGAATITVCEDRAGTDESIRRAAEWVRENLSPLSVSPPQISAGEVAISLP
jgi:hypothetical protein